MKMQMEIRESLTVGTREMQVFLCYSSVCLIQSFECVLFVRDILTLDPPGLVFTS